MLVRAPRRLLLLYRYCRLALDDADLAQDTTLAVWQQIAADVPPGAPRLGRLFGAADVACVAHVQRAAPRRAPAAATLWRLLAALPDDVRPAVELQLCGWTTSEIAAALGCSPRAARARRARGLCLLAGWSPQRCSRRQALEIEQRWITVRGGQTLPSPHPLDSVIAELEAYLAPPAPSAAEIAALCARLRGKPIYVPESSSAVAQPRAAAVAAGVVTAGPTLRASPHTRTRARRRSLNAPTLPSPDTPGMAPTFPAALAQGVTPNWGRRARREAVQVAASALVFGLLGALLVLTLHGAPAGSTSQLSQRADAAPQLADFPLITARSQAIELGADVVASGLLAADTHWLWLAIGAPDATSAPVALAQIDLANGQRVATLRVTPRPAGAVLAFGSLWVSGADAIVSDGGGTRGELLRLEPASGRVLARIPLPGYASSDPAGIVADATALWVADATRPYVWRIDPATSQVVASVRTRRGSSAIAVGGDAVWVGETLSFRGAVARIAPDELHVTASFNLQRVDGPLLFAANSLWCFTSVAGVSMLARFDAHSGALLARVALPGEGRGLVERDGVIWVATSALDPLNGDPQPDWSNALLEVDPITNSVSAAMPLPVPPDALALIGVRLLVSAPSVGLALLIEPQ